MVAAIVALLFKEPFTDLKEEVSGSQFDVSIDPEYVRHNRMYVRQRGMIVIKCFIKPKM